MDPGRIVCVIQKIHTKSINKCIRLCIYFYIHYIVQFGMHSLITRILFGPPPLFHVARLRLLEGATFSSSLASGCLEALSWNQRNTSMQFYGFRKAWNEKETHFVSRAFSLFRFFSSLLALSALSAFFSLCFLPFSTLFGEGSRTSNAWTAIDQHTALPGGTLIQKLKPLKTVSRHFGI